MESFATIKSFPLEDLDSIIPTLSILEWESGLASMQSLQMAAKGYDPTAYAVPIADVVSTKSSSLVTSHSGAACVLSDINRTSLTTQVMKSETMFQHPFNPPIEGGSLEGMDQLQLHQSDVHALKPTSRKIMDEELTALVDYEKSMNPFLSLPIPPDVEVMHQIYSTPHGNSSMSLNGELKLSNVEDILKMPVIPATVKDGN